MTEDEAKTKWCPFVRAVDSARSIHAEPARCIGSAYGAELKLQAPADAASNE